MKIAHLWYTAPVFGGAETWATGLSKALCQIGVDSEIVCWKSKNSEKNFFRFLRGNVSPSPDIVDILMNGAFMAERLEEYDLVCSHHMDVIFPAVFSKSLHGSEVACMVHEPPIPWKLSSEGTVSYRHISDKSHQLYTFWKTFVPYVDFFFTNSKWNQQLHEKYEGISATPLLAGVDHQVYKPSEELRTEFRDRLGVDEKTVVLFYASAAGRRKRHEILLRSLRTLVTKKYKVRCVLTCSKDRLSYNFHPLVNRIIANLGLEEYVSAFPATTSQTMLGLYNACDIYVHPANNEHLGMAIMEAMASGKPVVAQCNGGVPEIIENGVEGLLFKTDSIDHMTTCIEKLIVDKDVRESMGRKALERSRGFDWLDVAKRFLEVTA